MRRQTLHLSPDGRTTAPAVESEKSGIQVPLAETAALFIYQHLFKRNSYFSSWDGGYYRTLKERKHEKQQKNMH
jgi:hypothetical protein